MAKKADRLEGVMDKRDRYLRIVEWARKRMTVHGWLILSIGGELAPYSKIEKMAWDRYMA